MSQPAPRPSSCFSLLSFLLYPHSSSTIKVTRGLWGKHLAHDGSHSLLCSECSFVINTTSRKAQTPLSRQTLHNHPPCPCASYLSRICSPDKIIRNTKRDSLNFKGKERDSRDFIMWASTAELRAGQLVQGET